jgi:nucleoside-diphosphate-sugar epimerase
MKSHSDNISKRKVLVTGATGFAGSHLVDRLVAAGYDVRVLVRKTSNLRWVPTDKVEMITADVRDNAAMSALVSGVCDLYHFGGLTRAFKAETLFAVNTEGTINLAKQWQRQAPEDGCFLYCSSLAASGPAVAADKPRTEAETPNPLTPYGQSKLAAEKWLTENLARQSVIVRPPAVYGPRDDAFISLFIWINRGWLPMATPPGSRASLIHARDLASLSLALLSGGARGVFHVDDGHIYSWEEIGEAIGAALRSSPRHLRIPLWVVKLLARCGNLQGKITGRLPVINSGKVIDIEQRFWTSDSRKARNFTGLNNVSIIDGMRETADWYIEHGWLG